MSESLSRNCRVCLEPESLCRCGENPVNKLASKLLREAENTARATVTIKHCDLLVLCERSYAWANETSKAILAERSALSETRSTNTERRALELLNVMVGTWDEDQRKRTNSIADEPWSIQQARKLLAERK